LGNVTSRKGTVLTLVADRAPIVETIIRRRFGNRVRHRSIVSELDLLVGFDPHGGALSGCVSFALAHSDDCRIAIWINIEAIHTGLLNCERRVGRINLVNFATKEMADMQIQCSLMQLHLNGVIAYVGERQTGLIAHAKDAAADVQLCTRFLVGPYVVGNRQWTIQTSCNPILSPTGLDRNRSGHVLQTRRPSGGIVLI
jgi:hypothetical protein